MRTHTRYFTQENITDIIHEYHELKMDWDSRKKFVPAEDQLTGDGLLATLYGAIIDLTRIAD